MAGEPEIYDLVVVGCGIGGLSAAVSAAEAGARVVLLERATYDERAGGTRYTEAFLRMKSLDAVSDDFEDRFAANAGGHLDPEVVKDCARPYADWPSILKTLSFADPEIVSAFAAAAPATLHWLAGKGIRFDHVTTPFITRSTTRMGPVGGGWAMVEALTAAAEAAGVTFLYETTAHHLLQDDAGAVVGVRARTRGAGWRDVDGRAVVLASGGFQGSHEMSARYYGKRATYMRPVARGGYYNKGEGIRMALAIGAAPRGDYGDFHAEPVDPRSGAPEPANFVFPYGILVDREGSRFTDEARGPVDAHYEAVTRLINHLDGGIAWALFDAGLDDVPNWRVGMRSDQPPVTADTIEALADAIGLPAPRLAATVAAYNAACRPGAFAPLEPDGLATEGLEPPKSNWARPLDRPPFRAWPVVAANTFTFGGLAVNADARVIDTDGEPIAGLYAAGETVGLYYGTYTGSTSVLKGAVFGRKAGLHAAARRPGSEAPGTAPGTD